MFLLFSAKQELRQGAITQGSLFHPFNKVGMAVSKVLSLMQA